MCSSCYTAAQNIPLARPAGAVAALATAATLRAVMPGS
jgi:hypothetical protein